MKHYTSAIVALTLMIQSTVLAQLRPNVDDSVFDEYPNPTTKISNSIVLPKNQLRHFESATTLKSLEGKVYQGYRVIPSKINDVWYTSFWLCNILAGSDSKARSHQECAPIVYNPQNSEFPLWVNSRYWNHGGATFLSEDYQIKNGPVWFNEKDFIKLDELASRRYNEVNTIVNLTVLAASMVAGVGIFGSFPAVITSANAVFNIPRLGSFVFAVGNYNLTLGGLLFMYEIAAEQVLIDQHLDAMDLKTSGYAIEIDDQREFKGKIGMGVENTKDYLNVLNALIIGDSKAMYDHKFLPHVNYFSNVEVNLNQSVEQGQRTLDIETIRHIREVPQEYTGGSAM